MARKNLKFVFLAALLALGGCVCRPGHVGYYGGFHPGGCYAQNTTTALT